MPRFFNRGAFMLTAGLLACLVTARPAGADTYEELVGLDTLSLALDVTYEHRDGHVDRPLDADLLEEKLRKQFDGSGLLVLTGKEKRMGLHGALNTSPLPGSPDNRFEMPFRMKYMPRLMVDAFVFTEKDQCIGHFRSRFEMWVRKGRLFPHETTYTGRVTVWSLTSWDRSDLKMIRFGIEKFLAETAQRFTEHWRRANVPTPPAPAR